LKIYIFIGGLIIYLNFSLNSICQKSAVTVVNEVFVLEHVAYNKLNHR
jgi:hypothetical protein